MVEWSMDFKDQHIDLVKKAKDGDREAFGELYRVYLDRIYRFVYFLVLDEPLAEDITQNTFLKAWNYLPKYVPEKGTFQSFVYKVARNLVIDHQRKKKEVAITQETELFLPADTDIEEEYEASERSVTVKRALSSLPDFDKEIVIMRYFEELSYSEISKVVGKKESAIRVRVHRALKMIKDNLKKIKI